MSNETTIKSIVNENISMKIFLSNMEQKHEHEKEATVDEIVKTCEWKWMKIKYFQENLCQTETWTISPWLSWMKIEILFVNWN